MPFKYKVVVVLVPLIFAADQITKWLVRTNIKLGDLIEVIPGFFDIVHVANKGAAFGMFSGASPSFRAPFFYAISAIATIVIIATLIKLKNSDKLLAVVFALILSGIAGNLFDRLRFSEVTDFLSFHVQDKVFDRIVLGYQFSFRLEWPAFNVADSAITIAMVLLVISMFKTRRNKE